MIRRTLTILIILLFAVLGIVLLTSEGGVSRVMERLGSFISRLFD
jgi:UPF0716 family protein affecting phage T7 exclusion